MEGSDLHDVELAGRLRRLDVVASHAVPGFDYRGLLDREQAARTRARRRRSLARAAAGTVVVALLALSGWRLSSHEEPLRAIAPVPAEPARANPLEPRLVRADTYLALAAIEDHIASIDDALNDARLAAPRGVEIARLERTRAELVNSYAQVRYAEMVSNNF